MLPEISLHYALSLIVLSRKGLIFFPDFCQLCLEKFRETEEEEEEFYKLAFKVLFQTQTDYLSPVIFDHCDRKSVGQILFLPISALKSTN